MNEFNEKIEKLLSGKNENVKHRFRCGYFWKGEKTFYANGFFFALRLKRETEGKTAYFAADEEFFSGKSAEEKAESFMRVLESEFSGSEFVVKNAEVVKMRGGTIEVKTEFE